MHANCAEVRQSGLGLGLRPRCQLRISMRAVEEEESQRFKELKAVSVQVATGSLLTAITFGALNYTK